MHPPIHPCPTRTTSFYISGRLTRVEDDILPVSAALPEFPTEKGLAARLHLGLLCLSSSVLVITVVDQIT